jgi:hypothetical protein
MWLRRRWLAVMEPSGSADFRLPALPTKGLSLFVSTCRCDTANPMYHDSLTRFIAGYRRDPFVGIRPSHSIYQRLIVIIVVVIIVVVATTTTIAPAVTPPLLPPLLPPPPRQRSNHVTPPSRASTASGGALEQSPLSRQTSPSIMTTSTLMKVMSIAMIVMLAMNRPPLSLSPSSFHGRR